MESVEKFSLESLKVLQRQNVGFRIVGIDHIQLLKLKVNFFLSFK